MLGEGSAWHCSLLFFPSTTSPAGHPPREVLGFLLDPPAAATSWRCRDPKAAQAAKEPTKHPLRRKLQRVVLLAILVASLAIFLDKNLQVRSMRADLARCCEQNRKWGGPLRTKTGLTMPHPRLATIASGFKRAPHDDEALCTCSVQRQMDVFMQSIAHWHPLRVTTPEQHGEL